MTLDTDPPVALMRAAGVPITRERYIDLAYGRQRPKPWTALNPTLS